MKLTLFETQILKTGFALEHRVSQSLRNKGWTVISSKYYVDDQEGSVREIDIVAYKSRTVGQLAVYTTLIVSCKKNESNVWALLSRTLDTTDPNRQLRPLHVWSNDKALAYTIASPRVSDEYHTRALKLGGLEALSEPEVDIFAFQEMSIETGAPRNDKSIFDSITSLMKAQSYELSLLPERKKQTSLYHFSLLSVVDAELIRISFDSDPPQAMQVETETFIANYILRKRQEFSKIRFIRASSFEKAIGDYDDLHEFNCRVFPMFRDEFYHDVLKDRDRVGVLRDDFATNIEWVIRLRLIRQFKENVDLTGLDISWNAGRNAASIQLPIETRFIEFLNNDSEIRPKVASALERIYRYNGSFFFEDDVPF